MSYTIEYSKRFDKQLSKLDRFTACMILKWLNLNIQGCEDPYRTGKSLVGNHKGKWRYRVGDYRVIVKVDDDKLIILALEIGHRREIY